MNKKSQQLSKAQWLEKALTQLVKFGPQQLKIANLCQNFEVTKGSFYHHFKSRDDFVHALMQYWYEHTTVNFIAQANTQGSPLEKLQKLDQVIASNNIEAEIHIRAWSLTETFIVTHLEKIDSQRQAFLASCYQQLGLNPEQATDLAAISYAQFLGLLHIKPQPDVTQCLKLSALIARQFLPVIQQGD